MKTKSESRITIHRGMYVKVIDKDGVELTTSRLNSIVLFDDGKLEHCMRLEDGTKIIVSK